jgi:hypothetical protein
MLNGVVIGFFAALIGAVLWAVVMGVTHREIGYVAIAVGALVGLAMTRNAAPNPVLPVIAAALAVFACLFGALLGDIALEADFRGISLLEGLRQTVENPGVIPDIYGAYFSPFDLLFWAIGAFAAFRFVRRAVEAAQLEEQQAANAQRATQLGSPYAQPAAPEAAPAAEPKPEADPV